MTNVLDYVHPLQGTASVFHYSNGNTLPLVSLPFGMASWSPQTTVSDGSWYFHPDHRHFYGLRLTQQPSPWINDHGHFMLTPQTDRLMLSPMAATSSFRRNDMLIKPDYFRIVLRRDGTKLEMTPTMRGAQVRLTFQPGAKESRLVLHMFEGESSISIDAEHRVVTGYTRANHAGAPDNFATYFVMKFDSELDVEGSGTFDAKYEASKELAATGEQYGAYVGLKVPQSGVVGVRIGMSFISVEQAKLNLERELGERSFEEVRAETAEAWSQRLGSIEIETADVRKRDTFYSCLYRACLFPKTAYEIDAQGNNVYYSAHSGGTVQPGVMYANIGFWDIYRTSLPLYTLLWPSLMNEMLQAWVNVYRDSGWMPKWISPGERSMMPGTLIDVVFADAYVKGIRDFDVKLAYEGLLKHATVPTDQEGLGRRGLREYEKLGYIPGDRYHETVSNTLDYYYGDFCISQLAAEVGTEEEVRKLRERAVNYKKLFDSVTGFMRPRNEDGSFMEPFDEFEWGGAYCEGGPWQCSWSVQHDLLGLAEASGGRAVLKKKLDKLFATPPQFRIGSYWCEIHEMSEMAAVDFGQFAISNQPSFHTPYIYTALGYPTETQYWVRKTMEELFSFEPDGFPGDEDNGSMSAWYLFSAMGLYPLTPGVPEYVTGSPLFTKVKLHIEGGKTFEIEAEGADTDCIYAHDKTLNGEAHAPLFLTHEQVAAGGKLTFTMSDKPVATVTDEALLPYSMSKSLK